jgi:hypothetical protein
MCWRLFDDLQLIFFQTSLVAGRDQIGGFGRKKIARGFSDDLFLGQSEIFLASFVDQQIAEIPCVLHQDRRGHMIDDVIQEFLGADEFLFRLCTFGDIFDNQSQIFRLAAWPANDPAFGQHQPRIVAGLLVCLQQIAIGRTSAECLPVAH